MTTDIESLARKLEELGQGLVKCARGCPGIVCDRTSGRIPRCLYFETDCRLGGRGVAVVGLNPGRSSPEEQQYYLARNCTYGSVVAWFRESGRKQGLNHPYYRHLRKLVDELGLTGPILWTELAKCENATETAGLPPLQTFRTCTGAFLQRELEMLPHDWPLFGVGAEAYKGLAYRFPNHTVIGVPHPTGSRGQFPALSENGRLREAVAAEARGVLAGSGRALWLTHGGGGECVA